MAKLTRSFDYQKCLHVDPFDGDFGDPEDRTLRDEIIRAGSDGPCSFCKKDITPGSEIRRIVHVFEGRIATQRYCTHCCAEMAQEHDL